MADVNLFLTIPQGAITATSLGVDGFARHRSPGSGRHFKGRNLLVDLKVKGLSPDFQFLNEGSWRDGKADAEAAMAAAAAGNRTKTALSNNAFSCTPVDAYKSMHLVKTGGEALELDYSGILHTFRGHNCHEEMSPSEVADEAGIDNQKDLSPRLYLVMCPIELVLFSNLTPIEYAWYATHRPGKIFRQVVFTELVEEPTNLAAQSRFRDAREEIESDPEKKTKTVVGDDCMNEIPYHNWKAYHRRDDSGVFVADSKKISVWRFPSELTDSWERARG